MLYGAKIMVDKYKELKTDFTEKSPINISKVNPGLHNKINRYINLVNRNKAIDDNKKFNVRDYILNLIEKDLNGLVLDNTFIKLDKQYMFNRNELKENKKAIATTKPFSELDEAIIIIEIPNNLDSFDKKERSYCYNGDKSVHAGYYIFNDIHYYFIYDSKEETIEVKIVDPNNMKLYVHDDKLKEKLLNDNSFIMNSLGNGLTIGQLFETSSKPIMYKYINQFELKNSDSSKPMDMKLLFNYYFEL